jgi:peptide/nickel transport system ATP-binding protein
MKLHSGSILLNGESVSAAKEVSREARQQMQVVFQDPYGSFNPRQKVVRLVSEPLFLLDNKPGKQESHALVTKVLESVGMHPSDADKYIHEFSGGQRQRIAIARALIIKPSLIILDEAVSALDVSVRAQVLELLHNLAQKEGLAYLFISHDLSVVQRVSDRVLVMEKGKIVEQGDTAYVFEQPQHPYTQQLIAAAPKLLIPGQ